MSAPTLLGLPPIPAELKPTSPYLQRAEELKQKEPIVAYWCTYYAAQVGISLKAKTSPARHFLQELLGTLESMKQGLGAKDAVDSEAASAAYVENFALRVFSAADNEERSEKITRSTAKKFVAAATFLEVLKVFPKAEISESTEDKVRYAKWKAAEIAKGFREGRLPAPASTSATSDISSDGPLASKKTSPPPPIPLDQDIPHTPQGTHLHANSLDRGVSSPGSWSTVATPGTGMGGASPFGVPSPADPDSPLAGRSKLRQEVVTSSGGMAGSHTRSESGSSGQSNQESTAQRPRRSSFAQKGNGNANAIALGLGSDGKKSVHFTPSTGGLTSTDDQSEATSTPGAETDFQFSYAPPPGTTSGIGVYTSPPAQPNLPTSVPAAVASLAPASRYSPPQVQVDVVPGQTYTSPSSQKGLSTPVVHPTTVTPSLPASARSSPPSVTSVTPQSSGYSPPSRGSPPQTEVVLTPGVIAKAQKHCRFAISSLDYDDAEQARKELRAALATLGG